MTTTAYYGWTKPTVGADADTWGSELNDDLDLIDTQIKAVADASAAQGPFLVPRGGIILWSGSAASIPSGWQLCNGVGGAPNLVNRFVLGADDSSIHVGATGGAATATPTITVGGHALSIGELPAHAHGVTDPTHTHAINDPGHSHSVSDPGHAHGGVPGVGGASVLGGPNPITTESGAASTNTATTGISVGASTNSLSLVAAAANISIQSTGGGTAHSHTATSSAVATTPPYYALCYIMKS